MNSGIVKGAETSSTKLLGYNGSSTALVPVNTSGSLLPSTTINTLPAIIISSSTINSNTFPLVSGNTFTNIVESPTVSNSNLYYDGRTIYTEKELNNLRNATGSANRGIEYIYEGPKGNEKAQIFQSGTTGAFSNVETKKGVIPALRYDNPNERGRDYIKFDGIEIIKGETHLIDSKINIPYWNEKAMSTTFSGTLNRINEAKKQNPDVKIIYEFPNGAAKSKLTEWLLKNDKYSDTIDAIRIRGEK